MKIKIVAISILVLSIFYSYAAADNGQVYFKFQVRQHDDIYKLTKSISIDNIRGDTVYAYATDNQFEEFKKLGYEYEILPDPGTLITPRMAANIDELITDWDTYPTYQQYLDMMNLFAATYPNLCTIVNIGSTVQGRQLLFAKLSDNVNTEENEPEVMYSSTMHGDETTGYVLMLRLIDYLLSNYGTDPEATNILNSMEIWINPLANPDGTYRGGNNSVNGAIRYNANGVDLNRNFPDPAAGQHPDGRTWQPETIAMMTLFDQHSFVISGNFHGGAEVVNYPWDTWARLHADDQWYINICRAYAESCQVYSQNNGYMTDLNDGITNGYAWYRVAGGRQDYMTYFKGGREVTIELSHVKLLPAGQLPTHWTYNKVSFLNYLENSLYGLNGTVTDSSTGQPLAATINVLNHDIDSARVFTDPNIGDYHRMLAPGIYDIQFCSPGYISQTLTGINVIDHSSQVVDVQLQAVPNTPLLSFSSHDAGLIDIGDTVSMHITLINNGGGNAQNVSAHLSSNDSYITILQDSSWYPDIPPLGGLGVSLSGYIFLVSPACPAYHEASFLLRIRASGGYIDSATFSIMIGIQAERFESGNFQSFAWQMGGNSNWTITANFPYEGTYCARSGVITHNQSSELYLQMNIVSAGNISFFYKVSSEAGYDFLKFFVDGNVMGQWAGDIGWTRGTYTVAPGSHIFKWGYYKDQSVSNGSDCGWIDFIEFPPTAQALQIITASLPDWTVNRPYSQQLEALGGFGNLSWSDLFNNLAGTGLTLSNIGLLSGTPVNAEQIIFTARVQDGGGDSAQRQYSFAINPAVQITTDSLPFGTVGLPYAVQLLADGGTGNRSWADRDGDLSGSGFSLTESGLISGSSDDPLDLGFTASVSDIAGDSDERPFRIRILGRGSYLPGDVNNSGQTNGIDVSYFIIYFKGGDPPPFMIDCPPHGVFYAACDVNGNCLVNGIDATYLVNFFKGGSGLLFCQDCPPGLLAPAITDTTTKGQN